jgi:hypothetical protein
MAKTTSTKGAAGAKGAGGKSEQVDDWRTAMIARIRQLIEQADPDVVEERKWAKASNPDGVPTWYDDGLICTGETYKDHVKVTFAKGGSMKDPSGLFNTGGEGAVRRAIDLHEGDKLNATAFKALIREAVALNKASGRRQ